MEADRFIPFESEAQLQRISPKVIKIVDNPDHCNLEITVQILSRIIKVSEEQESFRVRSYRFHIHPSTYSNINSLRIKLHDVLVVELHLYLGESDLVSVAETFINSLMMPCHDEHTTVVVAEFEKRELYRSLALRADFSMSKMARVVISAAGGESTNCAICLDEFANEVVVVKTPCAHLFHDLCLRDWLRKNGRNGCPMCRANIQVLFTSFKGIAP